MSLHGNRLVNAIYAHIVGVICDAVRIEGKRCYHFEIGAKLTEQEAMFSCKSDIDSMNS